MSCHALITLWRCLKTCVEQERPHINITRHTNHGPVPIPPRIADNSRPDLAVGGKITKIAETALKKHPFKEMNLKAATQSSTRTLFAMLFTDTPTMPWITMPIRQLGCRVLSSFPVMWNDWLQRRRITCWSHCCTLVQLWWPKVLIPSYQGRASSRLENELQNSLPGSESTGPFGGRYRCLRWPWPSHPCYHRPIVPVEHDSMLLLGSRKWTSVPTRLQKDNLVSEQKTNKI